MSKPFLQIKWKYVLVMYSGNLNNHSVVEKNVYNICVFLIFYHLLCVFRVRADQGVENVDIAHFMFTVCGTGRASFMTGKSTHNQRYGCLHKASSIDIHM